MCENVFCGFFFFFGGGGVVLFLVCLFVVVVVVFCLVDGLQAAKTPRKR